MVKLTAVREAGGLDPSNCRSKGHRGLVRPTETGTIDPNYGMVDYGDDVDERKRNWRLAVVLAMTLPGMAGSAAEVGPSDLIAYANEQGIALRAHVFAAKVGEPPHPAILFFFGGGWSSGTPRQFYPFAARLAKEGFVAIPMEYRVRQRHGTNIPDSMADAFAAFRWAQDQADELGIDPARIVVSGGSAGGHLAAAIGTIAEHPRFGPSAMVLYNPVTDLRGFVDTPRFGALIAGDAVAVSPLAHIGAGAPRTIIFHGEDDKTVPIAQSEAFCRAMTVVGNDCELRRFAGEGHGFFNAGRDAFDPVLNETVRFVLPEIRE